MHSLNSVQNFGSGVAHVKESYVIPVDKWKSPKNEELVIQKNSDSETIKDNSFPNKKKKTGRNHNRPKLLKELPGQKLCRFYWCLSADVPPESGSCPLEKCVFSHDIQSFMERKAEDLGEKCHNFDTYGFCNYGVVCRFMGGHSKTSSSTSNAKSTYECDRPVKNFLKKEIQLQLRKRTYDFTPAKDSLKKAVALNEQRKDAAFKEKDCSEQLESNCGTNQRASNAALNQTEEEMAVPELRESTKSSIEEPTESTKLIDSSGDLHAMPLKARERKKLDWSDKLFLAPLTTVGNLPFRRVCKALGADVTCSEMALATGLLQGSMSEWALVKRHRSEDFFGVQLCGSNADAMVKCAHLLQNEIEMDFVDINMGCPIDLIYKQGAGSALLRRQGVLSQMVQGMRGVLCCPVTLKMRTAIYKDTKVAHSIIQKAKTWHVDLFTVHGRSKEQRYLKLADWDYIGECVAAADPTPVYGNGDILTYADYVAHRERSKVAGVMIARGALMKPWLFTEIKEQREWDISSTERLQILKDFTNFGLEHWGSDTEGIEKTRRFLLEWLSFLYRYIPVGLLEAPQRINERPPLYRGRDDLETLMASPSHDDWIKISEMLLGPVPKNFSFLPKHKANSWG